MRARAKGGKEIEKKEKRKKVKRAWLRRRKKTHSSSFFSLLSKKKKESCSLCFSLSLAGRGGGGGGGGGGGPPPPPPQFSPPQQQQQPWRRAMLPRASKSAALALATSEVREREKKVFIFLQSMLFAAALFACRPLWGAVSLVVDSDPTRSRRGACCFSSVEAERSRCQQVLGSPLEGAKATTPFFRSRRHRFWSIGGRQLVALEEGEASFLALGAAFLSCLLPLRALRDVPLPETCLERAETRQRRGNESKREREANQRLSPIECFFML